MATGSVTTIEQFGMETIDAVSNLVTANRYLQAVVLLYSAIDTLAWADLASGDVTRSDFCRWTTAYMNPDSKLGCTAEDLYAARCALLHSAGAASRMTREGRAAELWYVTSPHSVALLEARVRETGANAKVLYFTALASAFAEGVMQFNDDLELDTDRLARCSERVRLWLRFLPTKLVSERI